MRVPTPLRSWSLLTGLAFALNGGCYNYKPVVVTILDARTARPVVGATLQTHYDVGLFYVAPRSARAATGADGQAKISVADDIDGVTITASALGYEENSINLQLYAPGVNPYASTPEWKHRLWPYPPVTIRLQENPVGHE